MKRLRPAAIKRHRLTPIDQVSRLILIERDPVEAVLSHTNRNGNATDDALLDGYKWWSSLRHTFDRFDESRRLLIRFDDILNGSTAWIKQLSNFLGLTPSPAEIDACARALPQAKHVLTRQAQTKTSTHYRDKFPQQAAVLDLATGRQ